jgi:8-hydroxy-5-deazaflavin:NADPH oxidoreductase
MNIGIIGAGNMGRALGMRWAHNGHHVLFGSRELSKAEAVAARMRTAHAGDFDAAAKFGDVILYTVRDVPPSRLLRSPQTLAGKVLIDCTNAGILGFEVPDPQQRAGIHFAAPVPSMAERLAADVLQARVVKAFNTIPYSVISLDTDQLRSHRVSVFLCSDDAAAKTVVKNLVEELGFVGIDSGGLERAHLVEAAADLLRFLIVGQGFGAFTTMSIQELPKP